VNPLSVRWSVDVSGRGMVAHYSLNERQLSNVHRWCTRAVLVRQYAKTRFNKHLQKMASVAYRAQTTRPLSSFVLDRRHFGDREAGRERRSH